MCKHRFSPDKEEVNFGPSVRASRRRMEIFVKMLLGKWAGFNRIRWGWKKGLD